MLKDDMIVIFTYLKKFVTVSFFSQKLRNYYTPLLVTINQSTPYGKKKNPQRTSP